MAEDNQPNLFAVEEWWEKDWKGMPEFVQKDLQPIKSVLVHFEKWEDMNAFAKLIEQNISQDTISLWYPKADVAKFKEKIWVHEEKEKSVEIQVPEFDDTEAFGGVVIPEDQIIEEEIEIESLFDEDIF